MEQIVHIAHSGNHGVNGIITDRPATLRAVCQELEIALPDPDPNPAGKPYYTGVDGL